MTQDRLRGVTAYAGEICLVRAVIMTERRYWWRARITSWNEYIAEIKEVHMPLMRLILFVLPFIVAWLISPIGLPTSIAKIGAGEASVLDWAKLGLLLFLGIVFSRIPRKGN